MPNPPKCNECASKAACLQDAFRTCDFNPAQQPLKKADDEKLETLTGGMSMEDVEECPECGNATPTCDEEYYEDGQLFRAFVCEDDDCNGRWEVRADVTNITVEEV